MLCNNFISRVSLPFLFRLGTWRHYSCTEINCALFCCFWFKVDLWICKQHYFCIVLHNTVCKRSTVTDKAKLHVCVCSEILVGYEPRNKSVQVFTCFNQYQCSLWTKLFQCWWVWTVHWHHSLTAPKRRSAFVTSVSFSCELFYVHVPLCE